MVNTCTRTFKVKAPNANVLEAEVYYSRGGYNYFTYRSEPRGYYFSLTPYEDGNGVRAYRAFSGVKKCVLECARQSKKRYEEAKAMMDTLIAENLERFCANNGIELLDGSYEEKERERKFS